MSGVFPGALALSLLLGVLLGALFTVLDAVRLLLRPGRAVVFLLDLSFCGVASAATFLLALAVSAGSLRFYQAGCEIIGFLSVYLSLTHAVRRLLPFFGRLHRRLSERLERLLKRVGKIFLRKNTASKGVRAKKHEFFVNKAKKSEKNT